MTYRLVLYVHLLGLLIATGTATVVHYAHASLRRARTLSEAGRWGLTMKAAARGFPVAVVLLVGSGAYMVSDAWSWSRPWVIAALTGLAAIVVLGELVDGRNGRKVGQAIGHALARDGDGPVPEEVTRLLERPAAIAASYAPTLEMLGVVFVMVEKPGVAGCAAALLVPLVLAAAGGLALVRRPGSEPALSTEAAIR